MITTVKKEQLTKLEKIKKQIAQAKQKIKTDRLKAIRVMNDLSEKIENNS